MTTNNQQQEQTPPQYEHIQKIITPFELYNTLLNINPSDSHHKILLIDMQNLSDFKKNGQIDSSMHLPLNQLYEHYPDMFHQMHHHDATSLTLTRKFLDRIKMWPMFTCVLYTFPESDENFDDDDDDEKNVKVLDQQAQLLKQFLQKQYPEFATMAPYLNVWALKNVKQFKAKYGQLMWTPLNQQRRLMQNAIESICNTQYANEVIENELFLGSVTHALDETMCKVLNVGAVVSVRRSEEAALSEEEIELRKSLCEQWLEVVVNEEEEVVDQFESVVSFIDDYLKSSGSQSEGKAVLVHDTFGVTHSAVFVVAYLIKVKKMNLIDAINLVKMKRIISRVPMEFMEQLAMYEIDTLQ